MSPSSAYTVSKLEIICYHSTVIARKLFSYQSSLFITYHMHSVVNAQTNPSKKYEQVTLKQKKKLV